MAQYSEKYTQDKKFALSCLRKLGGVKAGADGSIVEEMAVVVNIMRDLNQEPTDVHELINNLTTNIISGILFNETMSHSDPKLARFRKLVTDMYNIMNEFSMFEALLSPKLMKFFSGGKKRRFENDLKNLEDYIAEQVVEHRKTFDPANPRDFVDLYLDKADMEIGKGFYDTIIAFTADAVHSMSVVMLWIVLYLGHHPEIQKKIQAEIDDVIGPNQMVCK